jgi:polysaccharide pyruvyl transferase WcaK-like protein
MNVFLAGNADRQNRGCEAITITTMELLKKNIPDMEISVLSFDPVIDSYYKKKYGVKVERLTVPEPEGIKKYLNKFKRKLIPWDLYSKYEALIPYIDSVRKADVVLSLGGDNYTDDYGLPYDFWGLAEIAKKAGKKFVIWGASVGPFKSQRSLEMAKKGLEYVDLITARDLQTVRYLKELGCGQKCVRVADSAFLLEPEEVVLPDFDMSKEIIGFNISSLFSRFTELSAENVLDIAISFLKEKVNKYNIILVPHVIVPNKPDRNDALYMKRIIDEVPGIFMADKSFNSSQLKFIISKCDFFIGARTHSTIAALSSFVPTVTLSYSRKAIGMNEDIFGGRDFLLEATDYSVKGLNAKFNNLLDNKRNIKEILSGKMKDIYNMVQSGARALIDLMDNNL